ncbi:Uncharacterised protein [Streptococcus pneumoniae]|nr:hypothetical protein HMPREF0837_12087 [Streptococcus pneumoniae TCH8431/19A]CIV75821.1 Uncharacterised protein [Streptococcus pneumoniae]CIW13575.1 Uncharacterised protein [Streptococcus pneumoniae]CMW35268.1 Uncharacterised protein [Streptococcus pneumoniae]
MKPPIYFYIEIDKVIITLIIPYVNYFDLEIIFDNYLHHHTPDQLTFKESF